MSNLKSSKKVAHVSKTVNRWDEAVSDAGSQIQQIKRQLSNLKRAISIFKELKEKGEPFPGESQKQREAKNDAAQ